MKCFEKFKVFEASLLESVVMSHNRCRLVAPADMCVRARVSGSQYEIYEPRSTDFYARGNCQAAGVQFNLDSWFCCPEGNLEFVGGGGLKGWVNSFSP